MNGISSLIADALIDYGEENQLLDVESVDERTLCCMAQCQGQERVGGS